MQTRSDSAFADVWLAPDVHLARVGADLVILDARADRYLCLPDGAMNLPAKAEGGRLQVADPELRADLLAAGLVVAEANRASAGASWAALAPVQRTALPTVFETPRMADLNEMTPVLVEVLRHYWRRSFLEILAAARPPPDFADAAPDDVTLAIAARFQRWAPYAPTSAKCLLRAFMLLKLLHRHGRHARWVFGVRTWPFEAHCWLQCGDVALDDDVERVSALEPILVVG